MGNILENPKGGSNNTGKKCCNNAIIGTKHLGGALLPEPERCSLLQLWWLSNGSLQFCSTEVKICGRGEAPRYIGLGSWGSQTETSDHIQILPHSSVGELPVSPSGKRFHLADIPTCFLPNQALAASSDSQYHAVTSSEDYWTISAPEKTFSERESLQLVNMPDKSQKWWKSFKEFSRPIKKKIVRDSCA